MALALDGTSGDGASRSASSTVGVKTSGLFELHPVLSYTPT